jgi:SAM-dependent methyltransferase
VGIEEIAAGLRCDSAGYWATPATAAVSYPEDGHDFCLSVEESSFWFAHRNRAILAALDRFPPGSGPLLDVGAGNGFVAAALIKAGIRVVPIEPSPVGAANAVKRGLDPVVCGSLPDAAFRERSAGGIGLFDVLEHVDDDRAFLASLRPYLTPDGRLYLTTPAYRLLWSDDDVAAGHYRRYSLSRLDKVLAAAGFRVEYSTYFFSWLPLPALLLRGIPSLVRRITKRPFVVSRTEHTVGGGTARRIAAASFAFELGLIARGRRVPLGTSCLVVARSA